MLSSSISYDILCYPLKNHFYDRLGNQLQINLDKLFLEVEKGLLSNEDLTKFSVAKMNNIFETTYLVLIELLAHYAAAY